MNTTNARNVTPSQINDPDLVDKIQEHHQTTIDEENSMKAIVHSAYGPPDNVLKYQDVDKPVVNDDEVLVRVHAAGVGIGDWLVASGLPYVGRAMYGLRKPKNRIAGHEMAGKVETVGRNVTRFQVGDEVFGQSNGAFAEYVTAAEETLVHKPANVTLEQAAAVPVSALAALQALRDSGEIKAGQQVLVIGASGGVGTFAVQIAKALEAEVTGVCSTRNVEMVRSLGADHVIDYTGEDIGQSGKRYDLIVDLAGNRSLSTLRSALGRKGTLVIVGGSGGPWLMGVGRTVRAVVLSLFVPQRLRALFSTPNKEDLLVLKELLESGQITPVIDRTYPLSETPEAIRNIGERHTQGKTVITV
jgi:NADPH:quinone reductase-like Zn-dependent oxidoreductase